MMIKKFCQLLLFSISIFIVLQSHADDIYGQVLQINTHFKSVVGEPTWLLELREVETGRVLPYVFEIRNNDNYWVAFSSGHTYRVTASSLTFGPYAKIANFCHLQDGILTGKSMWISLTGNLSPDPNSIKCHVIKYSDRDFTVVNQSTNG